MENSYQKRVDFITLWYNAFIGLMKGFAAFGCLIIGFSYSNPKISEIDSFNIKIIFVSVILISFNIYITYNWYVSSLFEFNKNDTNYDSELYTRFSHRNNLFTSKLYNSISKWTSVISVLILLFGSICLMFEVTFFYKFLK